MRAQVCGSTRYLSHYISCKSSENTDIYLVFRTFCVTSLTLTHRTLFCYFYIYILPTSNFTLSFRFTTICRARQGCCALRVILYTKSIYRYFYNRIHCRCIAVVKRNVVYRLCNNMADIFALGSSYNIKRERDQRVKDTYKSHLFRSLRFCHLNNTLKNS